MLRRNRRGRLVVLAIVTVAVVSCGERTVDRSVLTNDATWIMHPIDSRFRGSNALGGGDVNGDGLPDYVTNYEFDQRYVVSTRAGRGRRLSPISKGASRTASTRRARRWPTSTAMATSTSSARKAPT